MPQRTQVMRAAVATALACALVVAGCGDDGDDTANGSSVQSAEQAVDSAVSACRNAVDQLPAAAGSAVTSACGEIAKATKRDLNSADGDVSQALSKAADSCKQAADKVPAGEARTTVSQLCDAIAGAG